jgi:hypothetical protein
VGINKKKKVSCYALPVPWCVGLRIAATWRQCQCNWSCASGGPVTGTLDPVTKIDWINDYFQWLKIPLLPHRSVIKYARKERKEGK